MIFKDYYKILGLKNNHVTEEEIKIAYRESAKKYHPDVNIYDMFAEERFKDINEAYRVLSDKTAKRKYDRIWYQNIGRKVIYEDRDSEEANSIFTEFSNIFFGKKEKNIERRNTEKKAIKGENIETQINIKVQEAFYGIEKKISLRTIEGGMKSFSIKIPAGIRNNEKIRLIGQGKVGINGGKNGDLLIQVVIDKDAKFELQGNDLYTGLLITPWEAVLGTKLMIDGIDEIVSIYIPAGTQSGEKIIINQKGYKNGKGGRGDLIAQVQIMVPKQLSQEELKLYKKLKEISNFNPRQIH